jgi:HEAT repeat protein
MCRRALALIAAMVVSGCGRPSPNPQVTHPRPPQSSSEATVSRPLPERLLEAKQFLSHPPVEPTSSTRPSRPSSRVEEVIKIISEPASSGANSSGLEPQVQLRLSRVSYRPAKPDESVLTAAMRNEKLDIPARLCAAYFLLQLDNAKSRAFVSRHLTDTDPRTAAESAYVLVSAPASAEKWAIDEMIKTLGTSHLPYYALADVERKLGALKAKSAVPGLIERLKRQPTSIGNQGSDAAVALGEIGDPAAIPALLQTVEANGELQRFQAIALLQLKSPELLPVLIRHLDDCEAVAMLARMQDRRAIEPMKEYLRSHPQGPTSPFDLEFALTRLQAKDQADLAARLLVLLEKQTNGYSEGEIVEALGNTHDPRAVGPILRRAQTTNHDYLLSCTIHALGTIGNDDAVAGLGRLLERDYSKVETGKPSAFTFPEIVARELEHATGQNLGERPQAWQTWLKSHGSAEQAKVIAEIKKLGGTVEIGKDSANQRIMAVSQMDKPVSDAEAKLFEQLTGVEEAGFINAKITDRTLEHIATWTGLRTLWLDDNPRITDAGMKYLEGFPRLQELLLDKTPITDVGLEHVKGLHRLRELSLWLTHVTDAGLAHLEGLTSLEGLELKSTRVTDAGMKYLAGLVKLQRLGLTLTKVSDAGLKHLTGLVKLQRLDLGATKVSDVGLHHLEKLTTLQFLDLGQTQITDAGLEHLKGLTQLTMLVLDGTRVTDVGLEHLRGLTNLKGLCLNRTSVTKEGIKTLQKALPNCQIEQVNVGSKAEE